VFSKQPPVWSKFSIKTKLMLFFTLIVICISILSAYILNTAFKYLDIYEDDLVKNASIHNLGTTIAQSNASFENYIMYSNETYLAEFTSAKAEIWNLWSIVWNQNNVDLASYFQINAIRYGLNAYFESAEKTIFLKGTASEDFTEPLFRARKIYSYIDMYLQNLVSIRLGKVTQLHSEQVGRMNTIKFISFGGVVLIALLFIAFGVFFSESISKPIRLLAKSSSKIAEGELNIGKLPPSSQDEIGILTSTFNTMSKNIHEMVESLKDKAELEKQLMADEVKLLAMNKTVQEAQFLSLQSQINPHFLFNTLNTISRMSLFEQAPKTVRLIESLSNLLRYNLNNQNTVISIADEITMLQEYIHIQKTRYGSRLTFSVDCQIDAANIFIPVFTLQPLVENAVKYGIEPMESGGEIRVGIFENGIDEILITIADTGAGFAPSKAPDSNSPWPESKPEANPEANLEGRSEGSLGARPGGQRESTFQSTGIGLKNVQKRLNIYFHGKEKFIIESSPGKGTTISITIPGKSC